ncbi:hypothetical protein L226DRAFT_564026 [Lentinus tigrinus ALCF2SS1-7]|uniref:Uncharacterized protein n=1 Tax=Lentinus tigrinus ALCF2SS1-6 TaxID=1328759 RepID=A0A5C2RR19_9APHY|nr:hypothetical protein L227DRAFT_604860 [Lentinus tigrinus ALCF2SS1-6]RPD68209.1 hypothetical protein L226DRAFT_564026 [Lentinus tigrinus ALCF2SS1-7]
MDNGSGHAWNLDQSRVENVESIAGSLADNARALYPWWNNLGYTLVEASMLTCAFGFLTLLAARLSYVIVSRRLKDSYLTLAIWIIPEWLTATTRWMKALSRIAQEHALLGIYIPGIQIGMNTMASCLAGKDCVRGPNADWKIMPAYTAHGCVSTALLATNVLIHEGVLCALVLFIVLPEFNSGRVLKGIVVAPFLAACVSAIIVNVKKVCLPGDIILDSGLRIQGVWEIFEPGAIDPTTASLTRLSHLVALFVLALWIWKHRQGFVAQLSGSTEQGFGWVKPLLVMYVTPPVVIAALQFVQRIYHKGGSPRDGPMWAYALFSAAYSVVPPLMGMWPGLVMIYHRLKMPDSILPITRAKDDVAAPTNQSTGMKVDLTTSSPEGKDGSQPSEKSSGPS